MKYFIDEIQRKQSRSSCYFEFQQGYYEGRCWLDSSVSISQDLWEEYHLSDIVFAVIPDFAYYGITTVNKEQWTNILNLCDGENNPCYEVFRDIIPWTEECFKKYEVFSILGI